MIILSEVSALFSKDLRLGRLARAVLHSVNGATSEELAHSNAILVEASSTALEQLSRLGLVSMSSGPSNRVVYIVNPEIRTLIEQAISAMEDDFITKRAAEWQIDAQGRLEWIEGMYQMIQNGKRSYHANLR